MQCAGMTLRTWLPGIIVAFVLCACADDSSQKLEAVFTDVVEMRDGVPVVNGDIKLQPFEGPTGAVLVEIVSDRDYQITKDEPSGRQRGRVMDGLVVARSHFRPTGSVFGPGKYWIRVGRFMGQREFGVLASLVEVPIDQRMGYLFMSDESPQGAAIRNAYLMGEFRPIFWEPGEPPGGPTLGSDAGESAESLTLAPGPGFHPVSERRLRKLRTRPGALGLAARSGMFDVKENDREQAEVWESEDLQTIVALKKLNAPYPGYAWDALGGELIKTTFPAEERMPLTAESIYHQNLFRLGHGTRRGLFDRMSSVSLEVEVMDYPAVETSLNLTAEKSFVRAFDFLRGTPSQRFALWIIHFDTAPDRAWIRKLLDSMARGGVPGASEARRPSSPPPADATAVLELPGKNRHLEFDPGSGWTRLEGEGFSNALHALEAMGGAVSRRVGGRGLDVPPGTIVHRHASGALLMAVPLGDDVPLVTAGRGLSERAEMLVREGFSIRADEQRNFVKARCHLSMLQRDTLQLQSAVCQPSFSDASLFSIALVGKRPEITDTELLRMLGTLHPSFDRTRTRVSRLKVGVGTSAEETISLIQNSTLLHGTFQPEQLKEGWFAPGEYVVASGTSRSDFVEMIIEAQTVWIDAFWAHRDRSVPLESPKELLVLASLVECHARAPEFFDPIASVFVNRLRYQMRLQSDAALIYGITRAAIPPDYPLKQSDLAEDTPWNTYLHDGLPPTPICAPSTAALGSASGPPSTDYLYFVSDAAGGFAFADTLATHHENVRAYREAKHAQSRSAQGGPGETHAGITDQ